MRRIVPIIIFVIGLLLVIVGVTGVLKGTTGLGVSVALFGALLFGLSFVPAPGANAPGAPLPLTPFERVTGIFYEPARVFQNLRAHPRWLAAFLVIAFCNALYTTAFVQRLTPEVIANKMADKIIEGGWVPDDKVAEFREGQVASATSPATRVGGVISSAIGFFVLMTAVAGLYLLGVLMFGGRINFWQALSIAFYAALPVIVIQKLLSLLLLYLKSPDDINPIMDQNGLVRDNLGVLFSPAEQPVLFVAASFIGVLSFYGLWLAATGLRHGGERVSAGSAWAIALIVWAIGLLFAIGSAALFPNFLA